MLARTYNPFEGNQPVTGSIRVNKSYVPLSRQKNIHQGVNSVQSNRLSGLRGNGRFPQELLAKAMLSSAQADERLARYQDSQTLFQPMEKIHTFIWRENVTHRMVVNPSSPPTLEANLLHLINSYVANTSSANLNDSQEEQLEQRDKEFFRFAFKQGATYYLKDAVFGKGDYQLARHAMGSLSGIRSNLVDAFGLGEEENTEIQRQPLWDAETVISRSQTGLLEGKYEPVCELFPELAPVPQDELGFLVGQVTARYKQLKRRCSLFFEQEACFLALQNVSSSSTEVLKEKLLLARLEDKCKSTTFPFVGLRLPTLLHDQVTEVRGLSVSECGSLCLEHNCASWSVSEERGEQICRYCVQSGS